jgi:hypothetical protein
MTIFELTAPTREDPDEVVARRDLLALEGVLISVPSGAISPGRR